ncbi:transketolase [Mariluticola halotolerans]|uniref:transketolase n=1 Tax=Mariluticola halotolerans TaxID=2909283 RepID=UPI0026E3464D|nr:transketolase [Mariluticola halotolerans]UJQ94044.1 transketolase [Mariluticola halotolerans]
MTDHAKHVAMANAIRFLSLDAVEKAKSGHLGLPLGAADIATVLFSQFLRFDPKAPDWPNRDRFVLSAGHGSMLLYALLHLLGYEDMTIEEIKNFRQLGSKTAGHPEYGHAAGIETTTGPLGQGVANAVGMAIAEAKLAAEFGDDVVDHFTYALVGDGCLMEGISHEAAALAGHLRLNKLIVLWDNNDITIDGYVSLADSTDQVARFKAYGWNTIEIDGHDPEAVAKAIAAAQDSDLPTFIACKTTAGYGAPTRAGKPKAHGGPYGAEEAEGTRKDLHWDHEAFTIPNQIMDDWRLAGLRSTKLRVDWEAKLEALEADQASDFKRRIARQMPLGFDEAIAEYKEQLAKDKPAVATRKASNMALEVINKILPETVGGSADLNGSNLTKTSGFEDFSAENRNGRFINYGVREHGMAAAVNGIALHGGLLPYTGGFFVFSDYCRPSIRLAALMGIRAIHVMTHDSIGVGEDGPTHQPVEHLASLRAMPNIDVYRPADATETAECWQLALERTEGPSILALTRQNVAAVRASFEKDNLCARGAYLLAGDANADVAIFASGSEVEIAVAARTELEQQGISARVVSVPCHELFFAQDKAYRKQIIGTPKLRVAVEAGVQQGWERFMGEDGVFIGMDSFGASAPAGTLFEHFNITSKAIVEAVTSRL